MSEQEMQYADPEWQAPREQAAPPGSYERREPSFPVDDREIVVPSLDREKLIAAPEHHLRRRMFLSGLLVAGLGLTGGLAWMLTRHAAVLPALPPTAQGQKRLTENYLTIPFSAVEPRVIVNSIAGEVKVTGAPIAEVVFQTGDELDTPAPEALSNVTYELSPDGNTITINVGYIRSDEPLRNIILNLQVPSNAALEIHTRYWIVVTGMSSQMNLSSTDGASGIYVQSDLSGNSIIHAVNSLIFNGSLDPHGTYNFQCDNGSVMLYLPWDSSFQLHAQASSSITNAFKSNTVGKPPRASLNILTYNGLISITGRL